MKKNLIGISDGREKTSHAKHGKFYFSRWMNLLRNIKKVLCHNFDRTLWQAILNIVVRKRKWIEHIYLEVCSGCQYNCELCAHDELRTLYRNFHLSMEELERFIHFTCASNYHIHRLEIHGPGEPLLWKYFNEGLEMLAKSGRISQIVVTSNGLGLDRITKETWKYIYALKISVYPFSDIEESVRAQQSKHRGKIAVNRITEFYGLPEKRCEHTIPCRCACPGPMFLKDKIFLFCGPPVFNAAKLKHVNIFERQDLYVEMGINYLERLNTRRNGNLDLCEYCWANGNIPFRYLPISQKMNNISSLSGGSSLEGVL